MEARHPRNPCTLGPSLTELVSDSMDTYNWKDIPVNQKCTPHRQLHTDLTLEANSVTTAAGGCPCLLLEILAALPTLESNASESVLTGDQQNDTWGASLPCHRPSITPLTLMPLLSME